MLAQQIDIGEHAKETTDTLNEDVRLLAKVLLLQVAWADLNPDIQRRLLLASEYHQVFPTLYTIAGSPSEFYPLAVHYKARLAAFTLHAVNVTKLLTEHHIPVIWMKGLALAFSIYPEAWLRPMRDIDFIVPMDRRLEARKILMDNGYTYEDYLLADRPVPPEYSHLVTHHFNMYYKEISLELHYDLGASKYFGYTPKDISILWNHTRQIGNPAHRLYSVTPELHIVLLALHDVFQHQRKTEKKDFRLYRPYDLYQLINRYPIDWAMVKQHAAHFRAQAYVIQALDQVEELFGLVPDSAKARELIANGDARRESTLRADFSVVFIGWNSFKVARRILPASKIPAYLRDFVFFPTPEGMRMKYNLTDDQPIWPYYIRRVFEHLATALRYGWHSISRRFSKKPTA